MAPRRLSPDIGVRLRRRNDFPLAVRHDAQAVAAGVIPQGAQRFLRQILLVQTALRLVLYDLRTIKSHDISAELLQTQLSGNGIYAFRRPARRQDKADALLL